MRRQAVVFDMDGTLVDSGDLAVAVAQAAVVDWNAAHGVSLDAPGPEVVRGLVGLPSLQYFEGLLPVELAASAADFREVAEVHERRLIAAGGVSLYAGAKALLRELRGRDLKLALVSNCGPVYFGACLEALALREAFEFCACLGDGPSKQANVAAALAALGCEGGVMVGDRAGDVEAGKANGLRTIGLLHGYGGRDELREADALAVGFAGLAGLVDTVLESARASVPI